VTVAPLDLAVLTVYLLGVVALGLWIGRGTTSAAAFMVGDRDVRWWVVLLSIVATETSTVTFLSIPGFAYGRDLTWMQIAVGFLIGRVVVATIFLPQFFRGAFFTAYEVLSERFGGAVRRAASALFVLTRTLADGLRLFLTSLVLQEMTGLPLWAAVVVVGIATILYTFFGGIRAVLWTDALQLVVYMGGAAVALSILVEKVPGGLPGILEAASASGKTRWLDATLDLSEPYALLAGIVGGVFITFGSHGVDQMMVQRYLSTRGLSEARKALVASGVVIVLQFALFLLIGLGLWAFYQQFPPAVAFDRDDRVFARFILEELPTGVVGILLGAIFAAAMSTLSSSLNSCATTATHDLWRGGAGATDAARLARTRGLTAIFGLAQIAVGIGGRGLDASVVGAVLGIAGFTSGIVLGVFFLGLWAERVGERAALAGLVVGAIAMTTIFFATPLAWPWYPLAGSAITFAVGVAASPIWPRAGIRAAT